MVFCELQEKEFRSFLDKHPLKNFLQTPEMGHLRELNGWNAYYVGVKENDKIEAATLLLSHKRKFNTYEFYAPRGLLVDYSDKSVLSFFVNELKKFIKKKNGYILRIDPYYHLRERDIDGNIVEEGENHEEELAYLHSLGFKKSKRSEQISWSFSLDLDKDLDDILENMRTYTRRSIKKALKNHIVLKDATYEEVPLVKRILDATSERQNFANRDLKYFQNLYKILVKKKMARFVIADIPLKKLQKETLIEEKREKEVIKSLQDMHAKEAKIKIHLDSLEQIKKKKCELDELIKKYGDTVSSSVGIFITYGDEVLYLFGGNIKELMHFGSPHYIQWEMIRYAKENGYKRYNFYGISGNFNPNDKSYGTYEFKKGFTGYVEELIGEHYLVIDSVKNTLFEIVHKVKK